MFLAPLPLRLQFEPHIFPETLDEDGTWEDDLDENDNSAVKSVAKQRIKSAHCLTWLPRIRR